MLRFVIVILALIILAALLYKRDKFWDIFPHGTTEKELYEQISQRNIERSLRESEKKIWRGDELTYEGKIVVPEPVLQDTTVR